MSRLPSPLIVCSTFPCRFAGFTYVESEDSPYTRLISDSVATWSSRCCVTACHF